MHAEAELDDGRHQAGHVLHLVAAHAVKAEAAAVSRRGVPAEGVPQAAQQVGADLAHVAGHLPHRPALLLGEGLEGQGRAGHQRQQRGEEGEPEVGVEAVGVVGVGQEGIHQDAGDVLERAQGAAVVVQVQAEPARGESLAAQDAGVDLQRVHQ